MAKFFLLLLTAIISYGLGSINGAIISSKYIWKKDIRDYGSGNAGLTNFYRIFGLAGSALVLATDILKAVIAVLVGGWLMGFVKDPNEVINYTNIGKAFAGFCVMMGHAFPAFYQFKGGKGVLCGGFVVFLVNWPVGIICWLAFLLIVIFTRYVSLGSVCAAVLFPLGMLIFSKDATVNVITLFCALLLILKHSGNIGRLISRTEPKFDFNSRPTPRS